MKTIKNKVKQFVKENNWNTSEVNINICTHKRIRGTASELTIINRTNLSTHILNVPQGTKSMDCTYKEFIKKMG